MLLALFFKRYAVYQKRFPTATDIFEVLLLVVIYFVIGCAFYMKQEGWSFVDSLYFSMVTMSTVGYGDLSPTTAGSKFFTILFVVFGITVPFVRLSNVVADIGFAAEERCVNFINKLLRARPRKQAAAVEVDDADAAESGSIRRQGTGVLNYADKSRQALDIERLTGSGVHSKSKKLVDLSGDGNADYAMPMGPVAYWVQNYTFNVLVFGVLQLVSAEIFTLLLDGDESNGALSFGNAMYHCLITATTVGYGDVGMYNESARLFASFHILLSVSWLGASISQFSELKEMRTAQLAEFEHLQRKLDPTMITQLDTDGKGVSRLEFCIGMLSNLGATYHGQKLTWKSVQPFLAQFEALDTDKSGRLDKKDLEAIAEAVRVHANNAARQGFELKGQENEGTNTRSSMKTAAVQPADPDE